jgi:hypothetical protein
MNTNLKSGHAAGTMQIPDRYRENDSEENKVIYALSQIGEGSAEDVGIKISELDSSIEPGGFSHIAEPILKSLCEKGSISCRADKDNLGYYFIPEQQQIR